MLGIWLIFYKAVVVFRYLTFLLLAAISIIIFAIIREENAHLTQLEVGGYVLLSILGLLLASSLIIRLILKRMDIFFLHDSLLCRECEWLV